MNTLYDSIPSLDLNQFINGSENQKNDFAQTLGKIYHDIGFVAIRGHYLSDELMEKTYQCSRRFFALPDEVKAKYEIAGLAGQRGYVGKNKEHAKGRNTGDLKEFYHIGQENPVDKHLPQFHPNVWPSEIPEFQSIMLETYAQLEKTGLTMLRAIARYLKLDETFFDINVKGGNSILRPIHYYPIENPDSVPPDAVRAAEHGDINLITLLMGASADGLQVLRRDNVWIPITALPDQLVVNVGDMLERLTNKKLTSTIHRVVNPPRALMNQPRYSIPFFMHPRPGMSLRVLSSCVDEQHPALFEDITAGEFLDARLKEIGLKK